MKKATNFFRKIALLAILCGLYGMALADPIEIRTVADLKAVASNETGDFILMNDVDLQGVTWTEDNSTNHFRGTFNGNGKVIKNFTFTGNGNQIGFFKHIGDGGLVKNLGFDNAFVDGKGAGDGLAVIAGKMIGGTIENCYLINSYLTGTSEKIGGIVGNASGENGAIVTVKNCHIINTSITSGGSRTGGIAGTANNGAIIEECFAEYSSIYGGDAHIGGIVGNLDNSHVSKCFSSNTTVSGRDNTGGIVGMLWGTAPTVDKCYSSAYVHSRDWQAGGIVGQTGGGSNDSAGSISNCYFSGVVRKDGGNRAGGIMALSGTDNISIQNCINVAALMISDEKYRIASINGRSCSFTNNYALSTIPVTNGNDTENGIDVTPANAKTQSFYENTLGWNFTSDWKMLSDGYPVFTWQTSPVNGSLYNVKDLYALQNGQTLDLNEIKSTNGLTLSFSSNNPKLSITNGVASLSGITSRETATITITSGSADYVFKEIKVDLFSADPIEISSVADLNIITAYPTLDFKLVADIDLAGVSFSGLCSESNPFKGVFDGNGHVIKNWSFNNGSTSVVGFFRAAQNATIKNLGLENINLYGNNDIAGIVSILNGGSIEQCYVSNAIISASDRAAGILAKLGGSATVKNCYVGANITGRDQQKGGIVAASINGGGTIDKCYFAGTIGGGRFSGSMLGLLDSDHDVYIQNCLNLASSIDGNETIYRIGAYAGRINYAHFSNNYSLSTSLLKGNTVNGTTSDANGANLPNDADAKDLSFYTGTLGWSSDVWKILSDGYPVLKWQTTPVNIAANVQELYVLQEGETLNLGNIKTYNDLNLTFSCPNGKVQVDGKNITVSGLAGIEHTTISISAGNGTDFAILPASLNLNLYPAGVITLTTPEELLYVTAKPEASFELGNDIDLTGISFSGMCSANKPFKGTFDGKGHTVKGMNYNYPNESYIGLFKKIDGATVKNVGVENAYLVGNEEVGAIAGSAVNGSLVTQCYVKDSYIEGRDRAASIVARLESGARIENCYAVADVKAREHQAGGIAGATASGGGHVSKCYFAGTVTGRYNRACGIIGLIDNDADVTVSNCLNLASELRRTDGSDNVYRIGDRNNKNGASFSNNYSISTTLVSGNTVNETDDTSNNGANLPDDDDAKSEVFYTETLGWDFDNIWALDGDYPIFKWQVIVQLPDLEIADGETVNADEAGIFANIIFNSSESSTGQLVIPSGTMNVNGTVKLKKIFTVETWYPMGFPFAIENIYGDFQENPELYIYNPDGSEWGDFWVKSYNGNTFEYSVEILPNTGYILQFPTDFEGVEVTFTSETNQVLKNLTESDLSFANATYTLLANPSVANLALSAGNALGYHYYIYNRAQNKFLLLASGTATIKPFESFIAVKGIEQSALKVSVNVEDAFGIDESVADDSNDPVIKTQYYTLDGIEIAKPQNTGIYIEKATRASHKIETSKIIYRKGK
ncbi:MAG: hypothetical protein LBH32_00515 [Dysgonamonadaceae bacterium]|jgi:hypothetical protein|nr:hypothetical protein [Dysgonamonadaceae bacterium]